MFLNIEIDLLILKTYDGQFTSTTKKSLHITFKSFQRYLRETKIQIQSVYEYLQQRYDSQRQM